MMINIHNSGRYFEYQAMEWLQSHGYQTIRIPASAAGKQPLPDIIATKNSVVYAIEVKSTSNRLVRVDKFQIDKLYRFCNVFSFCECKPIVMVRFKGSRQWKIVEVTRNAGIVVKL
ncbi:Holliday junction resolvase [Acidianus rod-shaped virus 1]|uniref:Putative holliday junction resolvase n=1 Tax=Acidianus rod-shaped virus 1 TaxID=309181 RepID=Q50I46_9VIRU|nr:Holliday junction resolvase [Acidianus rod-shaped virus 1]CAI44180.1 putative holliday junction resolvase [Acidianus rod-shaped virus 1]